MKKHSLLDNYRYVIRNVLRYSRTKVFCETITTVLSFFLDSFCAIWMMRYVVDRIEKGGDIKSVFTWIACTAAGYAVLGLVRNIYVYREKESCNADVISGFEGRIFETASKADLICFDDPSFYQDCQRALYCTDRVVEKVFQSIINLLAFGIMMLNAAVYLYMLDAKLLLFCLIAFSTYRFGRTYGVSRASRETELIEQERKQNYVRKVFLDRKYAQEIRTSNIKSALDETYNKASERKKGIYRRYGSRLSRLSFLRTFGAADAIEIVCYVYAAIRILVTHNLSTADFAVMFSAVIQYSSRLRRIITYFSEAQENSLYVDAYRDFIEREYPVRNAEMTCKPFETIEMKNVCFGYNEAHKVLDNVSLKIIKGESVMIAGSNGAGKTTLVNILLRLYDPQSGDLLYNGEPVKIIDKKSYQKHFSCMQQNYQIYDISIEENVLLTEVLNSEQRNKAKVAAEDAGAGKWIQKTAYGMQSLIGKAFDRSGIEPSGGQKQSLAIARLRAADADIYILDEPSSALDPIAEAEFFEKINESLKGKTIIFISHRLAAARNVDRVVFMENGRIVETGSHRDLMEKDGQYAKMFKTQARYYQEEARS